MALTLYLHDTIFSDMSTLRFSDANIFRKETSDKSPSVLASDFRLLVSKLRIPEVDGCLMRRRLDEALEQSLGRFGATLVSGRAGTGKTSLAATFARTKELVAWYSVEPSDTDWSVFSRYFASSIYDSLTGAGYEAVSGKGLPDGPVAQVIAEMLFRLDALKTDEQMLIVLDDLHHVFDAPWFDKFFELLIYGLRENTRLLLTCRSHPPAPMWRLRSKQMLNLMDEKLLAFTGDETAALFLEFGLTKPAARQAAADSFGRIGMLRKIAEKLTPKKPASNGKNYSDLQFLPQPDNAKLLVNLLP